LIMQGDGGEGTRGYADKVPCFCARGSLISREEQNVMTQIENTATLVRLSDTTRTIAYPAEDMRDREEWVQRAVPYMGVCHARQASPRHGYETCHDLPAGH
jgi:hypothetical protein